MDQRPRGWSPRPQASHDATDHEVGHEVDQIARTLQEEGVTDRRRLAELVRASQWGPLRFRTALRTAPREGRIRPVRRSIFARYDLYGPVERESREQEDPYQMMLSTPSRLRASNRASAIPASARLNA